MSYTYVYGIYPDGHLEEIGEVQNSWRFMVSIWDGLMQIHGIPHTSGLDMKGLEKLWKQVADLPRHDALLCLATFDRCWFHQSLTTELFQALCTERRFDSACYEVARVIEKHGTTNLRGVAFSGSISMTWSCAKTDSLHRLDEAGHACADCGARLQGADHALKKLECCRE